MGRLPHRGGGFKGKPIKSPLTKKDSIFLTLNQAAEAICIDFRQYGPQILLFCEVIQLIAGGKTVVRGDRQKNGAWISAAGQKNMQWMDWPDLVEYLGEALDSADLTPELMAPVCARVFQTRAFPAIDSETRQAGVRIETGMEAFSCRQCGRCCRFLNYQSELTAADVQKWQDTGCTEILKWVGIFKGHDGKKVYRMWVIPGTGKFAEPCPFLKEKSSENRWVCQIHEDKPSICRQYPVTRKHAFMTGCPGFDRRSSG
jgi:Fe-S-cluster containining protein